MYLTLNLKTTEVLGWGQTEKESQDMSLNFDPHHKEDNDVYTLPTDEFSVSVIIDQDEVFLNKMSRVETSWNVLAMRFEVRKVAVLSDKQVNQIRMHMQQEHAKRLLKAFPGSNITETPIVI